jgi:hypothetical protein
MIAPKVLSLYNKACLDREFLQAIKEADNDKKPGYFAKDIEKALFASIYYGYLVGKHGNNWNNV